MTEHLKAKKLTLPCLAALTGALLLVPAATGSAQVRPPQPGRQR